MSSRRRFRHRYRNYRRQSHNIRSGSTDIPGFFFDPDKKRYFRIPSGPNNQNYCKSLLYNPKPKLERIECGSYLDLFNRRQLNLMASDSFIDSFLRLKFSKMNCFYNSDLSGHVPDYPVIDCKYLIGSPEDSTFITACTLERNGVLVQSFSLTSEKEDCNNLRIEYKNVSGINFCEKVTDLCIVDVSSNKKYVLFTSVDFTPKPKTCSSVTLCGLTHLNNHVGMCGVYEYDQRWRNNTVLWSCAWNKQTQTYAVGGENVLKTVNLENGISKIACKENCFSLAYNKFGNQLFAGTNIGNLNCVDLRCGKFISSYKLGRGISYIKLLNNENFIITSAYDGKLMQVDLRRWKPVVEYPEHVNRHLKLPFSMDEEVDVLCSVGQDQITRLWSLNEGKLLRSIQPDKKKLSPADQPMAWYSASWQILPGKTDSCLVTTAGGHIFLYK